jgi:hypothetical protein
LGLRNSHRNSETKYPYEAATVKPWEVKKITQVEVGAAVFNHVLSGFPAILASNESLVITEPNRKGWNWSAEAKLVGGEAVLLRSSDRTIGTARRGVEVVEYVVYNGIQDSRCPSTLYSL